MLIGRLRNMVVFLVLFLGMVGFVGCQGGGQAGGGGEGTTVAVAAVTEVVATETAVPTTTPAPAATDMPTATATATATATMTPSPSPSPTPTVTPAPTETPTPLPTETPVPVPLPNWLAYLNRFRAIAKLPPLSDREAFTLGSRLHSRYMVGNNEPIAHSEEEDKPYYDVAGDQAARNGNLFATSQMEANYMWSINFWVSAPFHLVTFLDPRLEIVGYGDYVEAVGDTRMAAVLDVASQPRGTAAGIEYPIMFPGDGSETWVVRHSLIEWPDPFDGCPGFSAPTGPPIVLLLGDGSKTPNVTSHRFAKGDEVLDSCLFDETSFRSNDSYAEKKGREILDASDAIVIMPRKPLAIDETYTAQVTVDGETYTWSFRTRRGPD